MENWIVCVIVVIAVVFCVPLAVGLYLIKRTEDVRQFRLELYRMIDRLDTKRCSRALDVINKWRYDDMLYSLKPLTLEAWFTGKEIDMLFDRGENED